MYIAVCYFLLPVKTYLLVLDGRICSLARISRTKPLHQGNILKFPDRAVLSVFLGFLLDFLSVGLVVVSYGALQMWACFYDSLLDLFCLSQGLFWEVFFFISSDFSSRISSLKQIIYKLRSLLGVMEIKSGPNLSLSPI